MNSLDAVRNAALAARQWLRQAHYAAGKKGFAHSCWLYAPSCWRWHKPYPETSGYLIENFIYSDSPEDADIAKHTSDWLCDIQHPEGYFYSGTSRIHPSLFNTAQILFGLHYAFKLYKDERYKQALNKSRIWLVNSFDENGRCTRGLYHPGYFASYYSRAIWPILLTGDVDDSGNSLQSLYFLWQRRLSNGSFEDMSFKMHQPFLTHTLAYTIEGFLESSILINDSTMRDQCLDTLKIIATMVMDSGKLYSRYDTDWKPAGQDHCVTGQAQLVSLWCRAFTISPLAEFLRASELLMNEMIQWQNKSNHPDYFGGFTASIPQWGNYFPFRMVNWTNKFFLDACSRYLSLQGLNEG